jgi:serine/threonine-protein kinase
MPALIGLAKDDAAKAIKDASPTLQVAFVEKENAVVDPGKVTNQSTDAGSDVDQFSTITVEIAKAPAPPPSPTPCPSSGSTANPTPSPGSCTPATKSTSSGTGGKDSGDLLLG